MKQYLPVLVTLLLEHDIRISLINCSPTEKPCCLNTTFSMWLHLCLPAYAVRMFALRFRVPKKKGTSNHQTNVEQ